VSGIFLLFLGGQWEEANSFPISFSVGQIRVLPEHCRSRYRVLASVRAQVGLESIGFVRLAVPIGVPDRLPHHHPLQHLALPYVLAVPSPLPRIRLTRSPPFVSQPNLPDGSPRSDARTRLAMSSPSAELPTGTRTMSTFPPSCTTSSRSSRSNVRTCTSVIMELCCGEQPMRTT
jgi:hypothetical protein